MVTVNVSTRASDRRLTRVDAWSKLEFGAPARNKNMKKIARRRLSLAREVLLRLSDLSRARGGEVRHDTLTLCTLSNYPSQCPTICFQEAGCMID